LSSTKNANYLGVTVCNNLLQSPHQYHL
jgi:hypothetical protein